jgi:tetratricopeptide (TPR) repeat protein
MGRAVAAVAAAQAGGNERVQTFAASTLREAQSRLATRIIDGYVNEENGRVTLKSVVRDEASGKFVTTSNVVVGDLFAAASEIARQTGAPVSAYTTTNAKAVQAYIAAIGEADPAAVEAQLRESIRLDPQYGSPYLALRELLMRTNRAQEAQVLMANASALRMNAVEKARLRAASARTPSEQVDALIQAARLQPGDANTLRQAAEVAMNLRLYNKALVALEELLKLTPNDEAALNMRGYSYVYKGEFEPAQRAFEEYRKRVPQSANAIDSTGEMLFYFRRYADAARLFMEAYTKDPGIVQGGEPFRAAYSQYLAGNLAEADRMFATWVRDAKDPRYSIWRRWTGRPVGDALPHLRALWALQDGDRAAALQLASLARQQASTPAAANVASIALLLAQPTTSPDEWRARIQKALPAPQQEGARNQLLGWALMFDGHAREAVATLRPLFERAPGQFNNEQRILLASALISAGQKDEAGKVMPYGFLPPLGISGGLDVLLYPIAVNTSKKLHG